jgi:organic hydroperoxide reductase OsmC/OhrA
MAAPFPHQYHVSLSWIEGRQGALHADGAPKIVGGPPAQFDGSNRWWSPEQLLLGSTALCLMTTFLTLAARENLVIDGYEGRADGTLDKTRVGIYFTRIDLYAEITVGASDIEAARRVLEAAKKHCIISNALEPPVELHAVVHARV